MKETHTYEKGSNRNLALMKRDALLMERDITYEKRNYL